MMALHQPWSCSVLWCVVLMNDQRLYVLLTGLFSLIDGPKIPDNEQSRKRRLQLLKECTTKVGCSFLFNGGFTCKFCIEHFAAQHKCDLIIHLLTLYYIYQYLCSYFFFNKIKILKFNHLRVEPQHCYNNHFLCKDL